MSQVQVILSWGECNAYVKKTTETDWKKEPVPVEDSTQLTPTAQDAMEAPVEGGELEARQAKANKYELVYKVRVAPGRTSNIEWLNGIVNDEYSVAIVPKNTAAKGIKIDRASVNVLDNIFDAKAGLVDEYHFTGLKPESGNIVKRGVITVAAGTGEGSFTLTQVEE